MLISHKQLKEINEVQIEILRAVSEACKQLRISFYMVHGSLLGTIRNHKFVPDDDDIDIALFRNDYDLFVKEAPKILEPHYFVQTNSTDPGYPLAFGKVRDSRTTYIIEEAKHIPMNHGIYIDVFPIDYCAKKSFWGQLTAFKYRLLNSRIATTYRLDGESILKKTLRFGTKILFPSQSRAIRAREKILTSCKQGRFVRISGGKPTEQCIPASWFQVVKEDIFEGIPVYIPNEYEHYLTQVYGDYRSRTLIENKISNDKEIEINACVIDTKTPYTEYI